MGKLPQEKSASKNEGKRVEKKEEVCIMMKSQGYMRELEEDMPIICIIHKDYVLSTNTLTSSLPSVVSSLLLDYEDVFPEEPPLRGIVHQIDFIPGSQFSNKAEYRSNPE